MDRRAFLGSLVCLTAGCAHTLRVAGTADPFVPAVEAPFLHGGVNAGFHAPLPDDFLRYLASAGRPLTLRSPVLTVGQARDILRSLEPYPSLSCLLLVEGPDQRLVASLLDVMHHPSLTGLEFMNEPDLWHPDFTPTQYADAVLVAYRQLRDGGWSTDIVSGGLFSVEAEEPSGDWHAHTYLTPLLSTAPADLVIGLHWYGDTSDVWLGRVRDLVGGRRIAITEFGVSSRTAAEDQAQLAYYRGAISQFRRLGNVAYCLPYQLVSGPSTSDLDNFGLLRFDGSQKPAAHILQELS